MNVAFALVVDSRFFWMTNVERVYLHGFVYWRACRIFGFVSLSIGPVIVSRVRKSVLFQAVCALSGNNNRAKSVLCQFGFMSAVQESISLSFVSFLLQPVVLLFHESKKVCALSGYNNRAKSVLCQFGFMSCFKSPHKSVLCQFFASASPAVVSRVKKSLCFVRQ